MIFYSAVEYMYALFIWFIFYYIPKRQGVMLRRSVENVAPIGDESVLMMDNEQENLKTVVRELEHDKRFVRNQIRMTTKKESESSNSQISGL